MKHSANYHACWQTPEMNNVATRAKVLDNLKLAGVTELRIDLGWINFAETAKGSWNEGYAKMMDLRFGECVKRGFTIVATLGVTPAWARTNPATKGAPPKPEYYDDYADMLVKLAKRYPMVTEWEVWNEPDGSSFWSTKDPIAYANLLAVTYPIFKKSCPTIPLVMGAPTYIGMGNGWFDKVFKQLAGTKCYDKISIHPYSDSNNPATYSGAWSILGINTLLKPLLAKHNVKVPITAGEYGYSTHSNTTTPENKPWDMGVTAQQNADYTVTAMQLLADAGMESASIYLSSATNRNILHQDNYGIMDKDGNPREPLFTAYMSKIKAMAKADNSSPVSVDPKDAQITALKKELEGHRAANEKLNQYLASANAKLEQLKAAANGAVVAIDIERDLLLVDVQQYSLRAANINSAAIGLQAAVKLAG